MTSEDIVRATLAAVEAHDLDMAAAFTSDDLIVSDATLPRPLGKQAFFGQMQAILQAFPDWKYEIRTLVGQDDKVTVDVVAVATHTVALQLPGLPAIPASGKRVAVPDRFIFAMRGDKIAAITIDSPANGGAAEMLRQLGISSPR